MGKSVSKFENAHFVYTFVSIHCTYTPCFHHLARTFPKFSPYHTHNNASHTTSTQIVPDQATSENNAWSESSMLYFLN